MRWCLVVAISCLASGCTVKPSCPGGDFGCLFRSLSVSRVEGGSKLPLTSVSAERLVRPDGGTFFLISTPTLELDPDGAALLTLFEDPLGCQPAYCFSVCARKDRCSSDARCIPAVKDGLMRGLTNHWLELDSQAEQTTDFDLFVTPVTAPGCPEDAADRLERFDSTARVGVAAVIEVSALRRRKPVVVDAGACLQASTVLCTQQGIFGTRSRCIGKAEYENATGLLLPAQPAADGTTGCFDAQAGTLVKPCLPGSTCRVGTSCGGGSVVGGVCGP